ASGGLAFGGPVLLLALFAFCWISGFDIIYGLLDIESDRATGVRSIPAALGSRGAQVVAAVVHLVAVAAAVWLWRLVGSGVLSGIALLVTAVGFLAAYWQHLPVRLRFFPTSAIVGIAASMIPLLGELE
ncbi:MAG: UbiA family prenyltransferase, partial [Phycisphaerae bacterium]